MALFTIIDYHCWARKWLTFLSLHWDCGHVSKEAALTCSSLAHKNNWGCWIVHAGRAGHYNDIPLEHEQSTATVHHCTELPTSCVWLVMSSMHCHASPVSPAVGRCIYILMEWPSNPTAVGTSAKLRHSLLNVGAVLLAWTACVRI